VKDCRVIHEDVDSPNPLEGGCDDVLPIGFLGHVQLRKGGRSTDFRRGFLAFGDEYIGEDDFGTGIREGLGDGRADPPCCSGDECDAISESSHAGLLSFGSLGTGPA
jgi:hypothetical protein